MHILNCSYGVLDQDCAATVFAYPSVYMSICMVFSSAVYAYVIGEMTNIVTSMDEAARAHNKESDTLNRFCKEANVAKETAARLRAYFRRCRPVNRWGYYRSLLHKMSPELQRIVTQGMVLTEDSQKALPFLHKIENPEERRAFIADLACNMMRQLVAAQERVIVMGQRMYGMYLIESGVAVECKGITTRFKVLTAGKWFGVDGILLEGNWRERAANNEKGDRRNLVACTAVPISKSSALLVM